MFSKVTVLLIVSNVVSCQMNGEFWWLNNDLTKLKHGTIDAPKFDDVNELDTDETAKVVFKDNIEDSGINLENNPKVIENENGSASAIHFRDETSLSKFFNQIVHIDKNNKVWEDSKKFDSENKYVSNQNVDEFRFIFPDDNLQSLLWSNSENVTKKAEKISSNRKPGPVNEVKIAENMMSHNTFPTIEKDQLNPENVCTFIKKSECFLNKGTLYTPDIKSEILETISDERTVCCIFPISTTPSSNIVFPDTDWRTSRQKRSNINDTNVSLKQRKTLMNRKYGFDNQRIRTTSAPRKKVTQKVVISEEYNSDPYWNIKNPNIRNPDIPMYQDPDSGYDDGSLSYGDDYTVELPKPGLIGLYSDHRQTSWTHNKNKGYSYDTSDSVEEEFESSLGYSNIDPRLDHLSTSVPPKPKRRRPSKLTATTSKGSLRTPQSQTVSFHSNPDFQVLQGFKLLNLVRNKNRFVRKTPDIDADCDSNGSDIKNKPQQLTNYSEEDYEDDIFKTSIKEKLFNECSKTVKFIKCENGKEEGIVEFGAHPWIMLVVLTKSPENVLCYATLVHARVAVTAADCVYGQSPGAISIIAGVRNMDEDVTHSQRRMVSIYFDTDYTQNNFGLNLALLHWKLPLILDATVQPTCLLDLPSMDDCVFVGWGGYDEKMRSDLRWQRASILSPLNCNKRLSKLQVNDALCAAVESRGTVTGVGGPLLCKTAERWSTVGVAVWREDVIILLPPRDWVIRNIASLRIL